MELVATHYVIHDESTIHGMGETKGKAWANWYEEYFYGRCKESDGLKCSTIAEYEAQAT